MPGCTGICAVAYTFETTWGAILVCAFDARPNTGTGTVAMIGVRAKYSIHATAARIREPFRAGAGSIAGAFQPAGRTVRVRAGYRCSSAGARTVANV